MKKSRFTEVHVIKTLTEACLYGANLKDSCLYGANLIGATQMLSIHKATLRRYIQEGRVQATRIGRPYYITEQNLRQIFDKEPATKP